MSQEGQLLDQKSLRAVLGEIRQLDGEQRPGMTFPLPHEQQQTIPPHRRPDSKPPEQCFAPQSASSNADHGIKIMSMKFSEVRLSAARYMPGLDKDEKGEVRAFHMTVTRAVMQFALAVHLTQKAAH